MRTFFPLAYLLFFLAMTTTSCQQDSREESIIDYSFFVAGHTYGNPTHFQYGLHPPLMNHHSQISNFPKMEMGFFTGDVVPKATKAYWEAAQKDMDQFNMPIHIAPGNHDRGKEYERIFEKYYYSFKHKNDLFIILSPTDWNIAGKQLEFLKTTLANKAFQSNNIFIFLHELVWWAPDNQFGQIEINYRPHYPGKTNFWEELFPLLDALPNQVILFAGDIGATNIVTPYMHYRQDNVTLIATGMGGGKEDNIIVAEVAKNGNVGYKLLGLNKKEIYELANLESYQLPSKD